MWEFSTYYVGILNLFKIFYTFCNQRRVYKTWNSVINVYYCILENLNLLINVCSSDICFAFYTYTDTYSDMHNDVEFSKQPELTLIYTNPPHGLVALTDVALTGNLVTISGFLSRV
jgi:hypothetical protein